MIFFLMYSFVDRAPIPKGNLARDSAKRQASALLPQEQALTPAELNPTSGLDAIIWLEVSNDIVLKRALGQMIDSKNNTIYHLEDNPPPVNQPVLFSLINRRDYMTDLIR